MPRKARPPAPPPFEPEDLAVQLPSAAAANVLAEDEYQRELEARALADRFGYSGSVDPQDLEKELQDQVVRAASAFYFMGVTLLLLKARLPHGQWGELLGRMGVHPRQAQRTMLTAKAFHASGVASAWARSLTSSTKLLTLAEELSPEEIKQIAEGGTAKNLTRGDVETMTAAELKQHCRKLEAQRDEERSRHQEALQTIAALQRDRGQERTGLLLSDHAQREALMKVVDEARFQVFGDLVKLQGASADYISRAPGACDVQRDIERVLHATLDYLLDIGDALCPGWQQRPN